MARLKKYMTQAEFTRHMQYKSRSYVTQLKAAGRLVLNDKGLIDVEGSKLLIEETADPNRDDVRNMHAANRASAKPGAEGQDKKARAKDPNQVTFAEARARKESAQAQQAEIELKKMLGELVNKADMQAAIADLVTTFRQSLEHFPHRMAADLVGKDINEIRLLLKQGVHDALHNLERGCTEKLNQQTEAA